MNKLLQINNCIFGNTPTAFTYLAGGLNQFPEINIE